MADSKKEFLHMRVHSDLKQQMRDVSKAQGMSMSTWVDQAIRTAIKEQSHGAIAKDPV